MTQFKLTEQPKYNKKAKKELRKMKFLALFNNEASAIAGFVGKTKFTNSENAKNILKFSFENVEVGILEIAQQLESLGVIKK